VTAPVPGTAGLTPRWLTEALAPRLDGATVPAAAAEPVGTGQVADSVRLRLTYDRPAGLPDTMIAKVPAADQASRAAARAVRTYEVEASFYGQLADGLPVALPACYFSAYDAGPDEYVVLLEDLAPAAPGDQLAGLSAAQAGAAVDELAALHAAAWDDPALAALPWLNRRSADSAAFTAALIADFYGGFRDRYAARLDPRTLEVIEDFLPRIGAYLARRDEPATLVHGDFRADNLLFGAARPAVLDWQTCAWGGGTADLAYFLASSLPVAVRREHEEELARRYHAGLLTAGVSCAWADCWDGYRRHAYGGIVMAIGAAMLVGRTARGDEMFCAMTDRHARHALDLDAAALLP
jgi:aminoglycoside phosphotransferase (APT) family kinase protein